jgi:hypothetical protein
VLKFVAMKYDGVVPTAETAGWAEAAKRSGDFAASSKYEGVQLTVRDGAPDGARALPMRRLPAICD